MSFRRRRKACRLSLRPSASWARARSPPPQVCSAVYFDERNLIARPGARRSAIDAERREPLPVLDQRHANERCNLEPDELLALLVRESRVCGDVIDGDRLAPAARVNDGVAEEGDGRSAREGRHAVKIGPADDEVIAIDPREGDAARTEMLTNQVDRNLLDLDRVRQRAQLLVERDQELPLGGHIGRTLGF